MEGKISNEMSSFYTGLVISSVFGEAFEEEFIEVASNYNFSNWSPMDDDCVTFTDLLTSWIQLGSKYIKMVASAAKYALVREKQKKRVPSALLLPQDVVLEFRKTCREVDEIRYDYDTIKLDAFSRSKMSKLEIRITIAERDLKIQKRIEKDPKIYQVWRLMNMNSGVIPPSILLRINRESKKNALELYQNIRACTGGPTTRDDKLAVKVLEDKCKRIVRRAYLNKLFAQEAVKFNNNPEKYIAPNFL